jgi:transcriptional regulator with XRE-family HTH domain
MIDREQSKGILREGPHGNVETGSPMDVKTRHPTLGSLLRALRSRHGWTLKEMSQRSEIPVSTLSKVEHDRLTLTYDKLMRLSQRLNISMSELFADSGPSGELAVTARRSIGLAEDAVRVITKNYDYYYMCPELRKKRMIPVLTRIRARSAHEFGELVRHAGEEYIYVLEGAILVLTEFYDPVTLHVNESIYIDSKMGHAYVTADGCEEATVLGICSSAEEGLMDSLMSLHGDVKPTFPSKAEVPRPSSKPTNRRR